MPNHADDERQLDELPVIKTQLGRLLKLFNVVDYRLDAKGPCLKHGTIHESSLKLIDETFQPDSRLGANPPRLFRENHALTRMIYLLGDQIAAGDDERAGSPKAVTEKTVICAPACWTLAALYVIMQQYLIEVAAKDLTIVVNGKDGMDEAVSDIGLCNEIMGAIQSSILQNPSRDAVQEMIASKRRRFRERQATARKTGAPYPELVHPLLKLWYELNDEGNDKRYMAYADWKKVRVDSNVLPDGYDPARGLCMGVHHLGAFCIELLLKALKQMPPAARDMSQTRVLDRLTHRLVVANALSARCVLQPGEDVTSIVMTSQALLKLNTRTQGQKPVVNCLVDTSHQAFESLFASLFYQSVVRLRYAFRYYGMTCSIDDKMRAEKVLSIADAEVSVDENSNIFAVQGGDNDINKTDHIKKNRMMLDAILLNCQSLDRVIHTLPWISLIFSIDNLHYLLTSSDKLKETHAVDDEDAELAELSVGLQLSSRNVIHCPDGLTAGMSAQDRDFHCKAYRLQRAWVSMFFYRIDTKKGDASTQHDNGLLGILKLAKQAKLNEVQELIMQDTAYVYNIALRPRHSTEPIFSPSKSDPRYQVFSDTLDPGQPLYISWRNLMDILSTYVHNNINTDTNAEKIRFIGQLAQYYLSKTVANLLRPDTGVGFWREFEEDARLHEESAASSRSTVLSYVKLRANNNVFMKKRHQFYFKRNDSTSGVVQNLIVRHSTNYDGVDRSSALPPMLGEDAVINGADGMQEFTFGPFTRVFGSQDTNQQVAKGCFEAVLRLLQGKSVVVSGYGISGAGKTSTLISMNTVDGKNQPGVLLEWLKMLMNADTLLEDKKIPGTDRTASKYFVDGIAFCAVEFYARSDRYTGKDDATGCQTEVFEDMNYRIPLRSAEMTQVLRRDRGPNSRFQKVPDLMRKHWRALRRNENGKKRSDDELLKLLGDVIVRKIMNTAYRRTSPTPNNDSSSRSHVVLTIKVSKNMTDKDCCYLHILDLAGIENRFDSSNAFLYRQFTDPTLVSQTAEVRDEELRAGLQKLNAERGLVEASGAKPNHGQSKCTVFERYVFNQAPFSFLTFGGADHQSADENDEEKAKFQTLRNSPQGVHVRDWFVGASRGYVPSMDNLLLTESYEHDQLWRSAVMNPDVKLDEEGFLSLDFGLNGKNKNRVTWAEPCALAQTLLVDPGFEQNENDEYREGHLIFDQEVLGYDDDVLKKNPYLYGTEFDTAAGFNLPRFDVGINIDSNKEPKAFQAFSDEARENSVLFRLHTSPEVLRPPIRSMLPIDGTDPTDPLMTGASYLDLLRLSKVRSMLLGKCAAPVEEEEVEEVKSVNLSAKMAGDCMHKVLNMFRDTAPSFDEATKLAGDANLVGEHFYAPGKSNAGNLMALLEHAFAPAPPKQKPTKVDPEERAKHVKTFRRNLRAFLSMFTEVGPETYDRVYAYVQMMLEVAYRVMEHKGQVWKEPSEEGRQQHLDARIDNPLYQLLIRRAMPLSAFIINKEAQLGRRSDSADRMSWVDIDKVVNVVPEGAELGFQPVTEGDEKFVNQVSDRPHRLRVVAMDEQDSSFSVLAPLPGVTSSGVGDNGDNEDDDVPDDDDYDDDDDGDDGSIGGGGRKGCSVKDKGIRFFGLPLRSPGPFDERLEEALLPEHLETMKNFITVFCRGSLDEVIFWVHVLFLFGITVGVSRDERAKQEMEAQVKYYMAQRAAEGAFINTTVNNMRDSLFDIVRKQQAAVNPYGRPAFLTRCAYYGCHPFLDGACFKTATRPVEEGFFEPIFGYIKHYENPLSRELNLQVCLIAVVNLSSSVLDPPGVPYIRYSTLAHGLRLFNALDARKNRIRPAVELPSPWAGVKESDVGSDTAMLADAETEVLRTDDTEEDGGLSVKEDAHGHIVEGDATDEDDQDAADEEEQEQYDENDGDKYADEDGQEDQGDDDDDNGWGGQAGGGVSTCFMPVESRNRGAVTLGFRSDPKNGQILEVLNPVGLDLVSRVSIYKYILRGLKEIDWEIWNAHVSVLESERISIRSDVQNILARLQDTAKEAYFQSIQDDLHATRTIMENIIRYNTASLLGNLTFVDQLAKRGGSGVCDNKAVHGMFAIDLPALCGLKSVSSELNEVAAMPATSATVHKDILMKRSGDANFYARLLPKKTLPTWKLENFVSDQGEAKYIDEHGNSLDVVHADKIYFDILSVGKDMYMTTRMNSLNDRKLIVLPNQQMFFLGTKDTVVIHENKEPVFYAAFTVTKPALEAIGEALRKLKEKAEAIDTDDINDFAKHFPRIAYDEEDAGRKLKLVSEDPVSGQMDKWAAHNNGGYYITAEGTCMYFGPKFYLPGTRTPLRPYLSHYIPNRQPAVGGAPVQKKVSAAQTPRYVLIENPYLPPAQKQQYMVADTMFFQDLNFHPLPVMSAKEFQYLVAQIADQREQRQAGREIVAEKAYSLKGNGVVVRHDDEDVPTRQYVFYDTVPPEEGSGTVAVSEDESYLSIEPTEATSGYYFDEESNTTVYFGAPFLQDGELNQRPFVHHGAVRITLEDTEESYSDPWLAMNFREGEVPEGSYDFFDLNGVPLAFVDPEKAFAQDGEPFSVNPQYKNMRFVTKIPDVDGPIEQEEEYVEEEEEGAAAEEEEDGAAVGGAEDDYGEGGDDYAVEGQNEEEEAVDDGSRFAFFVPHVHTYDTDETQSDGNITVPANCSGLILKANVNSVYIGPQFYSNGSLSSTRFVSEQDFDDAGDRLVQFWSEAAEAYTTLTGENYNELFPAAAAVGEEGEEGQEEEYAEGEEGQEEEYAEGEEGQEEEYAEGEQVEEDEEPI